MRRIVVQSYITLDGVVQSGGDPDEDRDGGFAHGGWMSAYNAQHDTLGEFGEIVGAWERQPAGRRGARRRLYRITPKGSRTLSRGRGEWKMFVQTIGQILAPATA